MIEYLVGNPGIVLVDAPEHLPSENKYALPLKSIHADVTIRESIALIKMTQEFFNPTGPRSEENKDGEEEPKPVEIVYKFPKTE